MKSLIKPFLVEFVASRTRTFGGGRGSEYNPIAEALKDKPPQFAAGVDVGQVVELVLEGLKEARKQTEQMQYELSCAEED